MIHLSYQDTAIGVSTIDSGGRLTVKKEIPGESEVVFVEPQKLIEITDDEMSSAEEDKAKNKIRDKSKN